MQAICDANLRPGMRLSLIRRHGRDYMMRSEKRNGRGGYGASPSGNRPPRRKRRRAGFFYMLLTLILSVVLWPVGMILLWRRKLRWRVTTKLLTAIITLFVCVILYGFGLTVQTDQPAVTRVQDSVNDFLDHSAEYVADGYTFLCDKGVEVWNSASDLNDAIQRASLRSTADALDEGAEFSLQVRETVSGWFQPEDETTDPDLAPDATSEAEPSPSPAPTEPDETDEPAQTNEPAPSSSADEPTQTPSGSELPLGIPDVTPDPETAQSLGNGFLSRVGDFIEAAASPSTAPTSTPDPDEADASTASPSTAPDADGTPAPESTTEPTATPQAELTVTPKPAGEAVVYYNANGVNYHLHSSCKNMSSAPAGTLSEAVERGLTRCKNCGTPDASILDAQNVVWVDEEHRFHLTDECDEFAGDWSLMTLEDALAEDNLPCEACQADVYVTACGLTLPTPTPEPTAEPTPTPSPSPEPTPSPTPEPATVTPERALKPAAEAMLYHSSNGGWYHTIPDCSGMGGAKLYPLAECVEDGFKRCRKCNAPLPELLEEHCLWMDEQGICHTSDECLSFEGQWTLIARDEALEARYIGCKVCGADEYLIPNTIVEYPEATATPAAE